MANITITRFDESERNSIYVGLLLSVASENGLGHPSAWHGGLGPDSCSACTALTKLRENHGQLSIKSL